MSCRRRHIPPQLQFDDSNIPGTEFTFFLKGRYHWCHEWIQRPFLHYLLRHSTPGPYRAEAGIIAQMGLQSCCTLLQLFAAHHRHGALWAVLRKAFGCSLLLVAAFKAGLPECPADWKTHVELGIETITKWEAEAEDLAFSRRVLQDILHQSLSQMALADESST